MSCRLARSTSSTLAASTASVYSSGNSGNNRDSSAQAHVPTSAHLSPMGLSRLHTKKLPRLGPRPSSPYTSKGMVIMSSSFVRRENTAWPASCWRYKDQKAAHCSVAFPSPKSTWGQRFSSTLIQVEGLTQWVVTVPLLRSWSTDSMSTGRDNPKRQNCLRRSLSALAPSFDCSSAVMVPERKFPALSRLDAFHANLVSTPVTWAPATKKEGHSYNPQNILLKRVCWIKPGWWHCNLPLLRMFGF